MMKRREFSARLFGGVGGASLAGATSSRPAAAQAARTPRKNNLMHVAGDYHSVAGSREKG